MNYTWNDYSGLVWGQEANSVANKSEYIRKEYARKSLKGLKYKKQKKENWMFCKVYKGNQKKLEKCTTSIYCLCKLWIWFTTKINSVKLIISYCWAWAQSSQQFFLRYYPWLIWPRWVCAADLGWWPFHSLEFWTGACLGCEGWRRSDL